MKLAKVKELLNAKVCTDMDYENVEVFSACGSDLMSHVLAYFKDRGLLLTGLNNPQVVRTAEMMDILCIVMVRGKEPEPEVVKLANEKGLVVMKTDCTLFTACGLLYTEGLRGGGY
ncbi:DRTGG domain-containing protein [Bacilliculturomica massiliensis]|uniref:DRTGG domain-containing protein n=1 Tax=Bacilliculturomica massiliensis TaxID=1917867 RepID=UPI00102F5089|nr:DRTGG domain-containing protein [Bacilliculturomica massiliensis]